MSGWNGMGWESGAFLEYLGQDPGWQGLLWDASPTSGGLMGAYSRCLVWKWCPCQMGVSEGAGCVTISRCCTPTPFASVLGSTQSSWGHPGRGGSLLHSAVGAGWLWVSLCFPFLWREGNLSGWLLV